MWGITRKSDDADELTQEVMMRLLNGDFGGADPNRGRFRDLLRIAVVCRQMLRRVRVRFAAILIDEVRMGLADPSPNRVTDELAALGLLEHVRDFLPVNWSSRGELAEE